MARCPSCGKSNSADVTTCICGTVLAAEKTESAPLALTRPLGDHSVAASLPPVAEARADDQKPKIVVKGYKPSLSGGNHACRIHFVNVGHEHRFDLVEFHCDDAFEIKESRYKYANLPVVDPMLRGFKLERDVRTLIDPKHQYGTYRLHVQLDLVDTNSQRLRYIGTVTLPVIPDGWSAEQKSQFFESNRAEINCVGSMVDLENISGNVKITADASSFRGKFKAEATARSFSLEDAIFWAPLRLVSLEEEPDIDECLAASITLPVGSPWSAIRIFALKDTVLGRVMTAPDEPEADILLDTPAGPKHDKMLGYLSRQHAVIRWKGNRFDLDTLGQWGIAVDGERMGKTSHPKMLRTGQTLHMPGVFPDGCVVLEVLVAAHHTLILANREKSEMLIIVAPETKSATMSFDWNPALPAFFHYQSSFWLSDPNSRSEKLLVEGQQVDLGPAGKGKLTRQPYPELNLLNYWPGEYADRENVGA